MKRYLIAGLLVWVPLGVTVMVIKLLVDMMDRSLLLLPEPYRPDNLLGFHIPGLGVVLTAIIVLVTGMVVANLFGRKLVKLWESMLAQIPLVRTIYTGVKQILETVFSSNDQSFRKVLLVEYPRPGPARRRPRPAGRWSMSLSPPRPIPPRVSSSWCPVTTWSNWT